MTDRGKGTPSDFATVDDYIASFPENVRAVLQEVRATIRSAAPGSDEKISYRIPTVTVRGKRLVYFAAWKRFVSIYPVPAADEELERELAPYRAEKSTVRFPLDQPVPHDLVRRLVGVLMEQRGGLKS